MPRRSLTVRVAATLAALTLGASLAACADTTRIPPAPTDTGAAEPLFTSDEEALAAAVAAYEEYAIIVDALLAREVPEGNLEDVAGEELVISTTADVEEFLGLGWTATARREIDGAVLQSRIAELESTETVVIYLCEDLSDVDVIDSSGSSVVEETRNPRTDIEVVVRFNSLGEPRVTEREVWGGNAACN